MAAGPSVARISHGSAPPAAECHLLRLAEGALCPITGARNAEVDVDWGRIDPWAPFLVPVLPAEFVQLKQNLWDFLVVLCWV